MRGDLLLTLTFIPSKERKINHQPTSIAELLTTEVFQVDSLPNFLRDPMARRVIGE
jgi:hypothetical protein